MFYLLSFLLFSIFPSLLFSSISSSLSLNLSPGSDSVYAVLPIFIDSENSFDVTISTFPKTPLSTPLMIILKKKLSNIEKIDHSLIIEQCGGSGIQICSINGTLNENFNETGNITINGTINGTVNETINGTAIENANGTVSKEENQFIYVYFICKSDCEFEYQVDFFKEKILEEGKNLLVQFNERTDQILKLYIPHKNEENINETRLQINFR